MAGSTDPTDKQRKMWSNLGWAMPDGSYYIRPLPQGGADDLSNAVRAVGRGESAGKSGDVIRKHILTRAKDLDLLKDIPVTWNPDGSLKTVAEHFDRVDSFLAHHGVKGMKWGVRQDRGHEGETDKTKNISKADAKFESPSVKTVVEINNRAADAMNNVEIPRINSKSEYKNADFTHDSPLRQKYYSEYASVLECHFNEAAEAVGTNASGTRKYSVSVDHESLGWGVGVVDVKHNDSDVPTSFRITPKMDDKDHILSVSFPSFGHSDRVDDFFEHFGVKGMHWGVRNGSEAKAAPSEDHANAVDLRKKARAGGGIHVLTNDELQTVNTRLNLERSYASLVDNTKQAAAGEKFVKNNLGRVKLGLDAVDTGVRVVKTVNEVKKVAKK